MNNARNRFILFATLSYAVLGLLWIFLSDRLLSAFTDVDSMVWLSMAKGVFFVLVSAAFLFVALGSVPPRARTGGEPLLFETLMVGLSPGRLPRWLSYAIAVVLTLLMLFLRQKLAVEYTTRPLLIMFMFPILLSALFGGLGPGLLSTAIAALGVDYLAIPPLYSLAIANSFDLVNLTFLIVDGLAVSLLSEAMRRSMTRLEVNRRLLDTVVSGTSDAVFVKDKGGHYLFANEATGKITGKPPGEIVGRDDTFLFPGRSAREVKARDAEVMARAKTQTHEERLATNDGTERVFHVTKGPMLDAEGEVVGLFGISRDVTERQQAEDEVRRLNQTLEQRVAERTAELQAANHELGELAYALTHNLGAPLRAIGGFSHVLMEEQAGQLNAEARHSLEQIVQAGTDMGKLIDGILALLRCTRGELHHQPVDFSALARRRLGELAAAEPARQVRWQVEDGLLASGDPAMLQMALAQLLDNAWKFTCNRDDAEIRVFAGKIDEALRDGKPGICVADNGVGFDMAYAQRLYQPFQRLHRQEEFSGAGIGLATVQRIVLRHGGEIRAKGQPGIGATFCISLPPVAAIREDRDEH